MSGNQFQLGSLLDELPDLVLLTDYEGSIRYANQRSHELLQKADLIGISFSELVDERDLAWFPKCPQNWIDWQNNHDDAWEIRLAIANQSQLASGKARAVSLPTDSSATFEGVLVVLRLVGQPNRLPSQHISRNLLLKAIASANSSIVVADMLQADKPLSYVNQGFLDISGYEASEVLGRNCRFLQSVGDRDPESDGENHESLEQIRKAIAAEEKVSVTLKNYRKDGTAFYNELHLTPVYEHGRLAAYVGVQNDVTRRVRSQRQLLERERTLSSFLTAAAPLMGIVELSEAGAVRHVLTNADSKGDNSSRDEVQLAQPPESANVFASLGLDKNAQKQWKAALAQCLREQRAVRLEYEIVRQEKRRYFRAVVNPVATEPEAISRCCYIAEDITDLVEAEKERSLMEAAVENVDESVVITKAGLEGENDPQIIYVNKAFTQITGYSAAEAVGQTPRILQGDLTNPTVLNRLKEGLLESRHFKGEAINYRKDGEPFVMEWTIAPITDGNNRVVYWVAAQQNVTHRRQLEKEVVASQAREQARIARDLHDSVQQRLSVVGGFAQIVRLKLKEQVTPEIDQLLTKLLEASKQAAAEVRAIAHGLSSMSKARDGLMRSLQQLATTTQEVLKVNCEFSYEQPVLIDDHEKADHLYRLTQEAVNNAIHHGKAEQILIGLAQTAPDRYTLTISDDGCGISEAALNDQSGGFGLNSMRYRAEIIEADFAIAPDKRGKGTVVTCTFPCQNALSNPT